MSLIFSIADPNSRRKINNLRKQIIAEKKNNFAPFEKEVLETAKINFDISEEEGEFDYAVLLDRLHGNETSEEKVGANICEMMKLHIDEKLHEKIIDDGDKDKIESLIKEAFIKLLPPPTGKDERIKKLSVRIFMDENEDMIEPEA